MALNIVTSVQPLNVDNIITFIYGDPGVWKTSLAFTAKNPILFDFDKGAHRAGVFRKDSVQIGSWDEVAQINPDDLAGYDTIVIDTAGRMLDMISDKLRTDSKNTRRNSNDLSMQGYGKLGSMFTNWLKTIRGMGKDIVLLAHSAEDKDGDNIVKRPDMVGGSKKEAYKVADMMGYMTVEQGRQGAVRMLNFMPSPYYFAKDSGQIGNVQIVPMTEKPTQLADIIQATKDHINSLSAEAAKAQQELDDLRSNLLDAETAEELTTLKNELNKSHPLYKEMALSVMSRSKILGITYDKSAGEFVEPDEPEPEPLELGVVEEDSEVQNA